MGNERLRKQMLIFMTVCVAICIIVLYMKDAENKKHGTGSPFSPQGPSWQREYYESGKIKHEGAFKDGYKKDGEWIYYREDGSVMLRETYNDGILTEVKEEGTK